jgi:outer membrane protein
MNIAKLLFSLVFPAMFLSGVHAQKMWTLEDCIDYAYKHNLTLRQKKLSVESSEVNLAEARMRMLPNLNASVSNGFNSGRSIDPFTNQFTVQNINNARIGISSGIILFNGFQIRNNIKMQQQLVQASNFDLEVSRNDIGLSISNAFLQVLFARELVNVSREQVGTTEEQLGRTRKFMEAGRLAESAVLDMQAQLANDQLSLVNAENQLSMALLTLFQLLDMGADSNDIIAPAFDNIPDPGIFSANQLYDSYLLKSAPELKAADARLQAGAYSWKMAKGAYYPRLSFGGEINTVYSESYQRMTGFSTYYFQIFDPDQNPIGFIPQTAPSGSEMTPFRTQLSQNLGQTFAFSLSIPIFNNYSTIASVKRARLDMENTKLSKLMTDNTIRRQISQAYTEYLAARARYDASKASYEAQQESFLYAEKRYNANLLGSADYRIQRNNLQSAQSGFLQAKYELVFRLKIIEFYKNGSIGPINR